MGNYFNFQTKVEKQTNGKTDKEILLIEADKYIKLGDTMNLAKNYEQANRCYVKGIEIYVKILKQLKDEKEKNILKVKLENILTRAEKNKNEESKQLKKLEYINRLIDG